MEKNGRSQVKRYTLKHAPGTASAFRIDYRGELNPSQLEAVQTLYGPQLVIAGAGSGKTRTLIYRVAYLVESGVDPQSILLLTFTRKAAEEMMRRASQHLDDRCSRIQGGTFHAYSNLILRRYAKLIGYTPQFTIVDRGDAEDIINLLRSNLGFTNRERRFPKKSTLLALISKRANTGRKLSDILAQDYPQFLEDEDDIQKISKAYTEFKLTRSVMDYDDLLIKHKTLLDEFPEVRSKLSLENRFIMIDEFQDTNRTQADIAVRLASEHNNILAVGDDSQSIYSFRGAEFRNIMDFSNLFSQCKITTLEKNYRSSQPILSFTNQLIENAQEKYSKTLFSDIRSEQKPVFIRLKTFDEQADFISQRVLDLREEGVPLNQIAVLFRSGWHSNELEVELGRRNIPFVKYGGMKFVDTAHVKDALALLKVIQNPLDTISWYRLLLLFEGIGPKTAERIARHVADSVGSHRGLLDEQFRRHKFSDKLTELHRLIETLESSPTAPGTAAERIVAFYQPLLKLNYDDYKKRLDDLSSLTQIVSRYDTLEKFLDDISLEPPEHSQVHTAPEDREDEKLILSTIHSAKGLEWHSVFVISLIDGFIPSSKALHSNAEIEEERRLLYVACTRAEENLYLLCPELLNRSQRFSPIGAGIAFAMPSRFLEEIKDFRQLTEEWQVVPELDASPSSEEL